MPTDASILLGLKPMQTTNPMEMYEAGQRIETNRLAGIMNGLKMDEYQRSVQDAEAQRGIVKGFGADTAANANMLMQGGHLKAAQDYSKNQADIAKEQATGNKTNIETQQKVNGMLGSAAYALLQSPTLSMQEVAGTVERLKSQLPAQYHSILDVSKLPQDPQGMRTALQGLYTQSIETDKLLTDATSKRNNDQNNFTSASNNAATVGASTANAELGDKRARDLNTIKQSEVTLKREAKDEATKLTKDGQLASFETMLGTLDRLSNHPGLSRSVGAMGALPTMPGSNSANFKAELNTFQSQAFIPMVAQLKGMGALSDAEGRKLTAAVGALDPSMGEDAIRASIKRITNDMNAAYKRMGGGGVAEKPDNGGASGSWGDTQPQAAITKVSNDADYKALPSGATFIAPDGKTRTKK